MVTSFMVFQRISSIYGIYLEYTETRKELLPRKKTSRTLSNGTLVHRDQVAYACSWYCINQDFVVQPQNLSRGQPTAMP